jgi:hypothetical protein
MSTPLPDRLLETEALDRLLSSLSVERTRHVVDCLRGRGEETVSLAEVAACVEARSTVAESVSPDRTAVLLHHSGLPALDGAGVLDYDSSARTVRLKSGPALDACLDLVDELGGGA